MLEKSFMNKKIQYKRFFQLTSIVTDFFPVSGAHVLDSVLMKLLGNNILIKISFTASEKTD